MAEVNEERGGGGGERVDGSLAVNRAISSLTLGREIEGNVFVEEPLRSSLRRRINPLVIFLLHAVTDFGSIPLLHPSVNEYEMPTVIPSHPGRVFSS